MPLKWAAIGICGIGIAIAAYGTWMRVAYPPRVVSTGTIEVVNANRPGAEKVRLLTRVLSAGNVTLSEVELPNGTWIDCGGDCASAARKAGPDFWDEQQKKKR
jgi:hypothetical protein